MSTPAKLIPARPLESTPSRASSVVPEPSGANEGVALTPSKRHLPLPPGPRSGSALSSLGSSVLKTSASAEGGAALDQSQKRPGARIQLRTDPTIETSFRKEDDPELFALWA